MKKTFTFLTALLFGLTCVNAQINYYVSENGNDETGDGSQASPFATIFKAGSAAVAEGSASEYVINVLAGTITETGTSALKFNRAVTLTIKGADAETSFIQRITDTEFETNNNPGGRLFQLNANENTGLTLKLEDLTIKNFGFTNTNGGALFNQTKPNINITMKRCNVYNGKARSGVIAQVVSAGGSLTLEDCYFSNLTTLMNGDITSPIICKNGTLNIKNCVFSGNTKDHSKTYNATEKDRTTGTIITLISNADATIEANIINNTFINNKVTNADFVVTKQSVINVSAASKNTITANIANNLFIDNLRANVTVPDVDINIEDDVLTYLTLTTASHNVMNAEYNFDAETSVNDVNASYTYTSAEIDFTMENSSPKVEIASNGVKYIMANGTSIKQKGIAGSFVPATDITGALRLSPTSIGAHEAGVPTAISAAEKSNLKIYSTSGQIIIKGETTNIKVYNTTGLLQSQQTAKQSLASIPVQKKGIYIVVAQEAEGSIISKKVVVQ
ncbi:MAG: hypothetical protein MI866_02055 [Bacteroidales bacterium]|nr:hypothetical protein [Bacteroidales bacterium]